MIDFVFTHPTDIVFGKDAEAKTGELISGLGRKVLFHYGGGSIKANGVYEKVRKSLDAAGIEVHELGGVAPNPRISLVYEGIEMCKKHGLEAILGRGVCESNTFRLAGVTPFLARATSYCPLALS